jgi:rod shape-determining protein MreC
VVLQPTGQISRLGTIKSLLQRFAFLALIIATFVLMLVGKADTVLVERARIALTDAVAPVLRIMSQPATAVADAFANLHELAAIRKENAMLREENARLLQWQSAAQRVDSQNRDLRALLSVIPEPNAHFVTARVIADTGGAFAQSIIIMAGHAEGVAKGQVVLSGEGLVGRVMQVGIHSSRVLLITDINSRLPVLVGESGNRAIMAGDNGGRPRLLYLAAKSGVAPGDKVVTSGDADAFPVGLPIGTVARTQDGVVEVEPHMSGDRLLFVRVFDFGLGNSAADTAPAAPNLATVPVVASPLATAGSAPSATAPQAAAPRTPAPPGAARTASTPPTAAPGSFKPASVPPPAATPGTVPSKPSTPPSAARIVTPPPASTPAASSKPAPAKPAAAVPPAPAAPAAEETGD